MLHWINPDYADFAGTLIRYRTDGHYPLNHHDGTLVCNRKNVAGSTDRYVLNNTSGKATYYFSAFTYDVKGNFSHTAHVSATPSTNPAAPSKADDGTSAPTATAGDGGGGGGCFIATAAYGSKTEKHVRTLTAFRDRYLLTNALGIKMVSLYYHTSPPIADYLRSHPTAKHLVRCMLTPVAMAAHLSLKTHPGILIPAVIFLTVLLVYFLKSVFAFLLGAHRQ